LCGKPLIGSQFAVILRVGQVWDIQRSDISNEFSTVAVVREYCGGYFSNKETPAYYSINAQFGKLLKRNERRLGISQVESEASETDDRVPPVKTTTSIWRRNA